MFIHFVKFLHLQLPIIYLYLLLYSIDRYPVEVLKTTLAPFNDVEEVSGMLGIPIDARGNPITSASLGNPKINPK
jgi:hypothetical protein